MSEQEQQAALRAEILAGIQAALSGPTAPAAPQLPGLPADATAEARNAAHMAVVNKPAHHRTADETAYLAAVADAAVHATLSKPIDQVTSDERAQLLRQVQDCAKRGWQ